ncbi:MAG: P1 family peptidase [Anaerolineae bacterium]|nr:P1 family peptidase [Anaerolineae bacterium]
MNNAITDISGIKVGHAQDDDALTGCTVVLCEGGAVGGIDRRGNGTSTRQVDGLDPSHIGDTVHAIMLSGGSAFGLDAAGGVMRYLEEKGLGFKYGKARIPTVPTAVLFDLGLGDSTRRPDAEMGYQSCLNASDGAVLEGCVGAGTGATVGKARGMEHAMKSGVGTASMEIAEGVWVASLMAINALGDVVDPASGEVVAGARSDDLGDGELRFANALEVIRPLVGKSIAAHIAPDNTVIGVAATNAKFNKVEANKLAQMAQNGVVRAVRPAHTQGDGDTMFALATGEVQADVNIVGAFAAQVTSQAIMRAVRAAAGAGGLPGLADR